MVAARRQPRPAGRHACGGGAALAGDDRPRRARHGHLRRRQSRRHHLGDGLRARAGTFLPDGPDAPVQRGRAGRAGGVGRAAGGSQPPSPPPARGGRCGVGATAAGTAGGAAPLCRRRQRRAGGPARAPLGIPAAGQPARGLAAAGQPAGDRGDVPGPQQRRPQRTRAAHRADARRVAGFAGGFPARTRPRLGGAAARAAVALAGGARRAGVRPAPGAGPREQRRPRRGAGAGTGRAAPRQQQLRRGRPPHRPWRSHAGQRHASGPARAQYLVSHPLALSRRRRAERQARRQRRRSARHAGDHCRLQRPGRLGLHQQLRRLGRLGARAA